MKRLPTIITHCGTRVHTRLQLSSAEREDGNQSCIEVESVNVTEECGFRLLQIFSFSRCCGCRRWSFLMNVDVIQSDMWGYWRSASLFGNDCDFSVLTGATALWSKRRLNYSWPTEESPKLWLLRLQVSINFTCHLNHRHWIIPRETAWEWAPTLLTIRISLYSSPFRHQPESDFPLASAAGIWPEWAEETGFLPLVPAGKI